MRGAGPAHEDYYSLSGGRGSVCAHRFGLAQGDGRADVPADPRRNTEAGASALACDGLLSALSAWPDRVRRPAGIPGREPD